MKHGELVQELHEMLHYHNCDEFLHSLVQAMFRASEDMEGVDSEKAEEYSKRSAQLLTLLEEDES